MKIAMLQQNFTVGDFEGNTKKILDGYREACSRGAELVVSSELCFLGYPPKDLLEHKNYIEQEQVAYYGLFSDIGNTGLIVGITQRNRKEYGKPLYNAAKLIENQLCRTAWQKVLLPSYDVFDETRYFEPADLSSSHSKKIHNSKVSMLICEDIWNGTENPYGEHIYKRDPLIELEYNKQDILIVINGSPYYWGKGNVRFDLVSSIAKRLKCCVIYVNQVGGNDDLIFDGRSFAVDSSGRCIATAKPFEEDIVIVDTNSKAEVPYPFDLNQFKNLYDALVLGTNDYVRKTGHNFAVVALSGGIDSAVTAHIAVAALGRENVMGVGMPSPFSSQDSLEDAVKLATILGIEFRVMEINEIYAACGRALDPVIGWYEPGSIEGDVTEENVQPRIRGLLVMAITNRKGKRKPLLISTGNKSETAMGFCTLYGDTAGGFAPISDVLKTDVYGLANYICRIGNRIPKSTLTKAPTADLRPNQKDEDSLPPYRILDPILHAYIEEQKNFEEIVAMGHDETVVRRVIDQVNRNEFKRRQMPPGLKVTSKAFGTGRRWPIAAKFL